MQNRRWDCGSFAGDGAGHLRWVGTRCKCSHPEQAGASCCEEQSGAWQSQQMPSVYLTSSKKFPLFLCYVESLFNFSVPISAMMLMFLPPAAVDQQVPVCWCVLCVMANASWVAVKRCCWVGTVGSCPQQQNQIFKFTFPALCTGLPFLQPTLSSQSPRVP